MDVGWYLYTHVYTHTLNIKLPGGKDGRFVEDVLGSDQVVDVTSVGVTSVGVTSVGGIFGLLHERVSLSEWGSPLNLFRVTFFFLSAGLFPFGNILLGQG